MLFNRDNLNNLCDNLEKLSSLRLNGLNISDLDEKIFHGLFKIERIDLYNNKLSILKKNLFIGLIKLSSIRVYKNNLSQIDAEIFKDLFNLTRLDLYQNSICELPTILFDNLVSLLSLNLSENKIAHLPKDVFKGLTNLTKLYLGMNELTRLDKNVFSSLKKLEKIDINNNQIEELDEEIFQGLSKLISIEISNNELIFLPRKIFNGLINLKSINSDHNKLDTLDSFIFEGLLNLEEVNFDSNQIRYVDENLFKDLKSVKILQFNNNKYIKEIPKFLFKGLKKLENIYFGCNSIKHEILELELEDSVKFISFRNNAYDNNIDSIIKYKSPDSNETNIEIINNKYKRIGRQPIGRGSFGSVYKVENILDKKMYAMKTIHYSPNYTSLEPILLRDLDCPYLIKFYESFEYNSDSFCIITEFCQEGDLAKQIENKINTRSKFEFGTICLWSVELLLGIAYLHSKNIVHRDLKPGNIFLSNGHIKIGDLGLAKNQSTYLTNFSSIVGTLKYMSPELMENKNYDFKVDVWSSGIIFYELIELKSPVMGSNIFQIHNAIVRDQLPNLNSFSYLNPFINMMLQKEVRDRPTSSQLVEILNYFYNVYINKLRILNLELDLD